MWRTCSGVPLANAASTQLRSAEVFRITRKRSALFEFRCLDRYFGFDRVDDLFDVFGILLRFLTFLLI